MRRLWIQRTMATVVAGVMALGGAVGLSASPAVATPQGCPKLLVIAVPGTGEGETGKIPSMLRYPTSNLGGETTVTTVRYPASAWYSDGTEQVPYGESKDKGVANTIGVAKQTLDRCGGTKLALIGFSQGANVAGDVAAFIGQGKSSIKPSRVAGTVLLADMRRAKTDRLIGPKLGGQGISGARPGGFGKLQGRTFQICDPKDEYCNVDRDSYLTRIVGLLAQGANPKNFNPGKYASQALGIFGEMMARGGPGKVVSEINDSRAREQIIAYDKFLRSGAHGNYPRLMVKPGVTSLQWAQQYLAGLA